MPSVRPAPVSAIIPTYCRPAMLRRTLVKVLGCDPRPAEILVHVDAGDSATPQILAEEFPDVRVLQSENTQGPGGGRNRLIAAASCDFIASFDDDSWPLHDDFFARAEEILNRQTDISLVACRIHESDERGAPDDLPNTGSRECPLQPVTSFVGCGCVFRRTAFLRTRGYIPLRYAYGLEEADVAIQMLNQGSRLALCPELHVFHACNRRTHHADPYINAAQIRNTALFAFLRYPVVFWPLGIAQTLNRVRFCLQHSRWRGLGRGLLSIPFACWSLRRYRHAVRGDTIRRMRTLQQQGPARSQAATA